MLWEKIRWRSKTLAGGMDIEELSVPSHSLTNRPHKMMKWMISYLMMRNQDQKSFRRKEYCRVSFSLIRLEGQLFFLLKTLTGKGNNGSSNRCQMLMRHSVPTDCKANRSVQLRHLRFGVLIRLIIMMLLVIKECSKKVP